MTHLHPAPTLIHPAKNLGRLATGKESQKEDSRSQKIRAKEQEGVDSHVSPTIMSEEEVRNCHFLLSLSLELQRA